MDIFEMTGFTDLFDIEKDTGKENPDIKAIFFDIDGTLLSHTIGKVPESTLRALKKVRENGIKVVVATGRDINELKKLPLDGIEFDAYLTLNGNICLDHDLNMFAGNEIDQGEMDVLVGIFKAGKIPFVLIGEKNRYINYVDDIVIDTQNSTKGTIPDIGEYRGEKIYQCLAFVKDKERLMLENMLDMCTITSWNKTGIDIISRSGGKAAGLELFLDKYGLRRGETMAFGDGQNDIEMIRYAGIGVAMGNGIETLKAAADYVTTDIDDNGIANALKHFGVID
jgi:Cof subfamily protein (haloacid dehalogenase superfamily)